MEEYNVIKRQWGKFVSIVSGIGKHKGTWDAGWKQKRTAQKYANELNDQLTQAERNNGIRYFAE